jgi:hypothetical protein
LKDWGVLPKNAKIDGVFGESTALAVKQFQRLRPAHRSQFVTQGLEITGKVDRNTWAELLKKSPEEITIVDRQSSVVDMPNGFPDVDTFLKKAQCLPEIYPFAKKNLPIILNECIASGVTDRGQIAYILATTEHESHFGRFMLELADGWDYEDRSDLGNTQPGDGPRFKGRGFSQTTGRRNYQIWSDKLGIDLIAHPEKAALPEIASMILVRAMRDGNFTGLTLERFIAGDHRDFFNARKVVNGLDRADDIAQIAEYYFRAIV